MKKLLSIVLLIAMLCTSVVALTACPDDTTDSDINMDIDLSQKINLNVLIPSSGKKIEEINNNISILLATLRTKVKRNTFEFCPYCVVLSSTSLHFRTALGKILQVLFY